MENDYFLAASIRCSLSDVDILHQTRCHRKGRYSNFKIAIAIDEALDRDQCDLKEKQFPVYFISVMIRPYCDS